MRALLTILNVWRSRLGWLLVGLVFAELAVCSSLLLMGQTAAQLGKAVFGIILGYSALHYIGSSRIILRYLERYISHDAMFRALADVRVWFYRRLSQGAAAGLGFKRSGDLLSRLVSDVQSLDNLYLRIFIPLITALITLPIVFLVTAYISFTVAFCVALLFIVVAFVLPSIMAVIAYHLGPHVQQAQAALQVQALDMATGLREIRLFDAYDRICHQLKEKQDALYSLQKRQGHFMAVAHALSLLFSRMSIMIILGASIGLFATRADGLVGMIVLFIIITALDNITDLSRAGFLAGQICHAAERVVSITHHQQPLSDGRVSLPEHFDITCEQVSFGWTKRAFVLKNVSLHLRAGERAALIGPSGGGKSSLVALLLKVASPQKGRILLGDTDLATVSNTVLRQKVTWLSQASHLFDDTIRENLLLGREGFSDEQLWQALEHAQISDFVRSLPDGLESWIGENGSRLSGGQGRRIALARVLLSSASVLILDEPTAGLDIDTERAFLQTLNTLDTKQTIILITHRLLGIERLDHVWRCEHGHFTAQPF